MKVSHLVEYFAQRFPLPGALFISTITALTTAGLYSTPLDQAYAVTTFFVIINFTALLLRTRIVDEFRDKHHDDKNFPERPYQRGIVNKHTLLTIGIVAFIVEIGAVWLASGTPSLLWYTPVLLFSLLMMKDFYIRDWLAKRFTTHFIFHEFIFIFYGIWLLSLFNFDLTSQSIVWISYFVALLVSIEVGRKFSIRTDPKGNIVRDTYTAVWGRGATINVLGILTMVAGLSLSFVQSSYLFALISAITVCALYTFKRTDSAIKAILIIHSVTLVTVGIIM